MCERWSMHDAQPLRMKLADDALSLRRSRTTIFDTGGAPVGRRSAHLCCDAARLVAPPGRDVVRCGGAAARCWSADAALMDARWSTRLATGRALSCDDERALSAAVGAAVRPHART
ncbi:nicalin [Dorcoceras hygrometricum]|uniref:Nicalin n=1 Tax=Dorcoceras hygrometricum TaxID=472368 RepID=A0A2Z7B228_9LAMI|nr:nicalin [Dorcoceras hygrometricum]